MVQHSNKPTTDSYRISSPELILNLLKRLMSVQAPVSIHLKGDRHPYPSTIIAVDETKNLIQLDELNDSAGHDALVNADKLILDAYLGGVTIRFSAAKPQYINPPQETGFYRIGLPRQLHYQQRRDNVRIKLKGSATSVSAIHRRSRHNLQGVILDLSESGMGFLIRENEKLRLGDILNRCRFQLADNAVIECDMEICFLQRLSQKGFTRIGCRFIDLAQAAQQTIDSEIARSRQDD